MNASLILFWAFGGVAMLAAFLCITRRSPVASALWLVLTMFSLAGIFVLLDAYFIAVIQVLVYAGAIMVLFLFVIMLLNLARDRTSDLAGWPGRIAGGLVALGVIVQLITIARIAPPGPLVLPAGTIASEAAARGAVGFIAEPLFRDFLVPFEVTSLLLLAAVVGAIVLAKRKI